MFNFLGKKSDDATSESAPDTAPEKLVENDSDGVETHPEEDSEDLQPAQIEGLAEMTQTIKDLQKLFEDQIQAQNSRFDTFYEEYKERFLEVPYKRVEDLQPAQTEGLAEMTQTIKDLQKLFQQQIARNANKNKMFDAIYKEMKEYKEDSLIEAFHKPIIHALLDFYDSFKLTEEQLKGITKDIGSDDDLSQFQNNLENVRVELEEVLYRLDVTPYEERLETLDPKKHKTLDTVSADTPEKDGKVAEVRKIGFYWRDKVFRPEEVTIFRFEKGEETDG